MKHNKVKLVSTLCPRVRKRPPPSKSNRPDATANIRAASHSSIHIAHSLTFHSHSHHPQRAGTQKKKDGKSFLLLLLLLLLSISGAFSAPSWNVPFRRVRSQGCFSAVKNNPIHRELRVEEGLGGGGGGGSESLLATLTDAMVLWTLGVIKAPRREGGGAPWESHAHAPQPAASWEVSGVVDRQKCAIRSARPSHGG